MRHGVVHGLNVLAGRPLQRQEIFEICAELEGHPDNAAPAAYGGFNVVRDGQRQMFTVSAQLHFVLLVPNFEIATEQARRVLPSQVSRLHAVENCRNACAITAAFASREYEKFARRVRRSPSPALSQETDPIPRSGDWRCRIRRRSGCFLKWIRINYLRSNSPLT